MNTLSLHHVPALHFPAVATESDSPLLEFKERLSGLYALAHRSNYVFGTPIGPFYHSSFHLHLPRFVYFGPHSHDESLRLAFLAGFDHADVRSSLALIQFIEHLALIPDLGQGLNLSLFPLLDVVGLQYSVRNRRISAANWIDSAIPEISLLSKDARTRGYHGFVRIETAQGIDDITVSLRGTPAASGVELISSEDFAPLPVRWEAEPISDFPADGPLSLVDDLPFPPFELTLRVPASWSAELYRVSISSILKRFILRYRGLQAYGQGI